MPASQQVVRQQFVAGVSALFHTAAGTLAQPHHIALQGIGAQLAGSGLVIKKTAVRGVDSFGMLCSAHDIGWSDEADGILVEMPSSAEPGDPCPADPPKVFTRRLP